MDVWFRRGLIVALMMGIVVIDGYGGERVEIYLDSIDTGLDIVSSSAQETYITKREEVAVDIDRLGNKIQREKRTWRCGFLQNLLNQMSNILLDTPLIRGTFVDFAFNPQMFIAWKIAAQVLVHAGSVQKEEISTEHYNFPDRLTFSDKSYVLTYEGHYELVGAGAALYFTLYPVKDGSISSKVPEAIVQAVFNCSVPDLTKLQFINFLAPDVEATLGKWAGMVAGKLWQFSGQMGSMLSFSCVEIDGDKLRLSRVSHEQAVIGGFTRGTLAGLASYGVLSFALGYPAVSPLVAAPAFVGLGVLSGGYASQAYQQAPSQVALEHVNTKLKKIASNNQYACKLGRHSGLLINKPEVIQDFKQGGQAQIISDSDEGRFTTWREAISLSHEADLRRRKHPKR